VFFPHVAGCQRKQRSEVWKQSCSFLVLYKHDFGAPEVFCCSIVSCLNILSLVSLPFCWIMHAVRVVYGAFVVTGPLKMFV
jgi:hypothetical protein